MRRWELLIVTLVPMLLVWGLDQFLKRHPGTLALSWAPHYTDRPLAVLLLIPLILGLVLYIGRPLPALALGLIAGGALSNMLDVTRHGYTWNMFPIPGTNQVCNLADICLVSGLVLIGLFAVRYWSELE